MKKTGKNEMLTLPLVTLRNMVVMPGMMVHFDVKRSFSITAVERAMRHNQKVFCVAQKEMLTDKPELSDLYSHGTVVEIKQLIRMPENMMRVLAVGEYRAELFSVEEASGCPMAHISPMQMDDDLDETEKEAMLRSLKELVSYYADEHGKLNKEVLRALNEIELLPKLIEQIPIQIPMSMREKQLILAGRDLVECYEAETLILANEIHVIQIKKNIQEKVKQRVDKNQRDYVLREQMKVIQEELGEAAPMADAEKFAESCEALEASEEIKERIRQEIRRYRSMSASPSESAVSRAYIETLLALPWNHRTWDDTDITRAERILNDDHFGMKKVKERVLEFLAVRAATNGGESPIICLVGPPGTGKTSIARSIAGALGKKYVRICLGGVRDEAEIRGHRRTYVGALPGRIIAGLKTAGVSNPLMLLDEIDKLGSDYKGDPSSALLEVLDSEQNKNFVDHYMEVPVDLSQVLFVATANTTQTIPAPLLDRMEIIEVNSYTATDKMHIAKEHLIPKCLEKNGLTKKAFSITDKALASLIAGYTKEAGVRGLERRISECMRKAVLRMATDEKLQKVKVTDKNLSEFLGKVKYKPDKKNREDEVGIVRGLAVTGAGGDTLSIEINTMPGKGAIELTGKLGDVMKESAQTAISYVRSVGGKYHIPDDYFEKHDLHLHVPEGAVPKDGPSAGIAITTAVLSAVTGRKVRANLAMTGEVTLRGRVLPIGGLKEKVLAAKLADITLVLVPEQNRSDVEELEEEITEGLRIVTVSTMEEVISEALIG